MRTPEFGRIALKCFGALQVIDGSVLVTGAAGIAVAGEKVDQYPLLVPFRGLLKTVLEQGITDSIFVAELAILGAAQVAIGFFILGNSKPPKH